MGREVPKVDGQEVMRIRNECSNLARKAAGAIGFIPRDAYIHAWVEKRLKIKDDPYGIWGFLLHSPLNAIVTIHQETVVKEARRGGTGAEMYMQLFKECLEANVERIRLHCATELEANFFWDAVGLRCVAIREPGTVTSRVCNRWEVVFPAGELLEAEVAKVLENPKTKSLANFLGIAESLKKGLDKRFRKKLFPGARLRRKKGEGD